METLQNYLEFIGQILRLDPAVFERLQRSDDGLQLALLTIVCAGLSSQIGHSVVLIANRVTPPRFALSIGVGSAFYLFNVSVWSFSLWLVGNMILKDVTYWTVLNVVGFAQAPHIFGFLVLIPFLGVPFGWLLSLYSLLAMLVGIQTVFGVSLTVALIPSGLSWLVLHVVQRTVGQPLTTLAHRVRTRVAGLEQLRETIDAHVLLSQAEARLERETGGLV
ncbi:MAG: YIP1 family protein [Trueperaceae bacterium]